MRIRAMDGQVLIGVLAVTASVALGACSNAPPSAAGPGPAAQTKTTQQSVDHNEADIRFLQDMIPHHAQAIVMSEQATTRAAGPQVKNLAQRIGKAQGPEIAEMTELLRSWNIQPPPTDGMGAPGMNMSMPGMMNDQQMRQLAGTSGPMFDRMFLRMMTEHHRGAITMAQTELATGLDLRTKQIANAIMIAQQAEIVEMEALLRQR